MTDSETNTAFASWSGGKDSCLALYLAEAAGLRVDFLLNMLTEDGSCSRSHGLRPEVLERQAAAMGRRIVFGKAGWDNYERDCHPFVPEEEKKMKNGVIVYVAGPAPETWTEESEEVLKREAVGADSVELITSCSGHFDIADAWYALTVKGMNHIVCKSAVFDDAGRVRFTGRQMRLCG